MSPNNFDFEIPAGSLSHEHNHHLKKAVYHIYHYKYSGIILIGWIVLCHLVENQCYYAPRIRYVMDDIIGKQSDHWD